MYVCFDTNRKMRTTLVLTSGIGSSLHKSSSFVLKGMHHIELSVFSMNEITDSSSTIADVDGKCSVVPATISMCICLYQESKRHGEKEHMCRTPTNWKAIDWIETQREREKKHFSTENVSQIFVPRQEECPFFWPVSIPTRLMHADR